MKRRCFKLVTGILLQLLVVQLFLLGSALADERAPGAPGGPAAKRPSAAEPRSGELATGDATKRSESERPWYDRIHIRGYSQLRYNRLGATNPRLTNDQGDRSLGADGGFYIRRARLVLFGEVAPFLAIYLQPDFASAIDTSVNVSMMRDWYADIFIDREKTFRFRVGQSKVPYGWELMQSSQNRLPFDRSDGINSAFVNERDLGAFFYFETPTVRRRFKHLVDSGLKGSGDFGMTAIGIANGQPLNTREKNDNKHFFARITYPFDIGTQTIEVAAAAYAGRFVPGHAADVSSPREVQDLRGLATFVLYPKPFGVQVEYNAGYGPELAGSTIAKRPLDGGYAMVMWRQAIPLGFVTPYVRVHRYDGGKKFEANAPRHEVRELNLGVEWQFQRWVELTGELMASDRTVNGTQQEGRLARVQLQFNY